MTQPVFLAPRSHALAPLGPRHGLPGHDLLPRARVTHEAPHGVMLRGLAAERGMGPLAPTIVARTEDDFVAAVQAVLAEPGGAQRLADAMAALPRDEGGHLKLFPPVQRVHQIVLVEACCAEPGHPRLDPRKITSAGIVIRKPRAAGDFDPTHSGWLAWQRRGEQAVGWVALAARPGHHGVSELEDPDARRRRALDLTGNAHIDAKLQDLQRRKSLGPVAHTPPSERTIPLHPLPEELCRALGRTILIGYLPVASDEIVASEAPARPAASDDDVAALQGHFMHYLREGGAKALPNAGERITPGWMEAIGQAPDGTGDASGLPGQGRWVQTLMQLHLEFDLATDEPEAAALRQAFAAYRIVSLTSDARDAGGPMLDTWVRTLGQHETDWSRARFDLSFDYRGADAYAALTTALMSAWERAGRPGFHGFGTLDADEARADAHRHINRFLAGATLAPALPFVRRALVALDVIEAADAAEAAAAASLTQPDYWAPVGAAGALAFARAAAERIRQREAAMFSGSGKRASEPGVPLALRCFVRLKAATPGCPPQLAWSGYSSLFTVAPWWESGGAKPRVIDMPDPFDRATLRKLKPNVGFALPARLGNLMTPANLKKIDDGNKPSEGGLGIDWICGFNIPIITLCALIVLNISLGLMNLIFWWLPFVKICLPVPAKKKG